MSRLLMAVATAASFLAQLPSGALAQAPPSRLIAQANVTVANDSPVPQVVAGSGVSPFTLPPRQQAQLRMSIVLPPRPMARSGVVPVRFEYSVGEAPGPQCQGTIDLRLSVQGTVDNNDQITDCRARSLGTDGAHCKIAVSARNAVCEGGLAFSAR